MSHSNIITANTIITFKKSEQDTIHLEAEIDELVMDLYELIEEERE